MRENRFKNSQDASVYNKGYQQGKADAIDECVTIVENEKWDYSITAKLEMLKEQNNEI